MMETIDNDLEINKKNIEPLVLIVIGIIGFLTLRSLEYSLKLAFTDIAIFSGITFVPSFILKNLCDITAVYFIVNFSFRSVHNYQGKLNGKKLIKWLVTTYIAIQIFQFFYALFIFDIVPQRYFDLAEVYQNSKPLGTLFTLFETILSYSSLIIVFISYKKHLRTNIYS